MDNVSAIKKNIKDLRQEFYRSPKDVIVLVNLGKKLLDCRKYKDSIVWFEKALILDKDNMEAIDGLAKAFLECGLFYSARKYCERSLSISPNNKPMRSIFFELKKNPVTQKKSVTFYVPCYNAERFIAACIEGILAQSYPISEVLIIDDGSSDKTSEIANRYPVRIIRHEKNLGLSSSRNTAIKHARGEYIASVDADVVADKYWLEYLIMIFDDDTVGGADGRLLEANGLTAVDRWRQVNLIQHWGKHKKINPPALAGCNTLYRKRCLDEVGGYNDKKFRNYHEDIDLSWRVKLSYKLIYEPRAIVRHIRTDSLKSIIDTYWQWFKVTRGELVGLYMDFNTLISRIYSNFQVSHNMVLKSIRKKRLHLLYLDIILGFRNTLRDILYMEEFSGIPKDIVAQTVLATIAGFRYQLERKRGVSQDFIDFVLKDLKDLIGPLREEYKSTIEKLGISPGISPGVFLTNYKKIKTLLPRAEYKFVNFILKVWNGTFKLKPLSWKEAEVSARRVRYEEIRNPNLIPTFRVMLLNPPWRIGERCGIGAGSRWPYTTTDVDEVSSVPDYVPFPFFLAYATALLKKNGLNAVIVDAIAEGLSDEEFLERIKGFNPELVLIETATVSIENDLEWAAKLKDINENIEVAFTGTHVSALGGDFLLENSDVDYLVIGEYEFAALELSESLKAGKLPKDVSGVIYRDKNGKIVSNGRSGGILNLDDLPLPERLTLPIYNYDDSGGTATPKPTVQVMASRGCPFGCIFCLWPQVLYGNRTYRARRPESVADEMEMLVKEYGFKGVYFDDDTFNIGKERILKLCNEIKRRNIQIPWAIMARADTSDFETLKTMRDAGLCALKFGVESGVQELVDNCGKGLSLKSVEEAVGNCRRLGIKVHLTFTFGLPGETRDTIAQTIAYALRLDPDTVQFSLTTPFPGTKYYKSLEENGLLLTKNWGRYDGNRYSVIRNINLSTKELEAAIEKAQSVWDAHCQKKKNRSFSIVGGEHIPKNDEEKGKIAIVDLLFTWPPHGGSASDINAVGSQLVKHGFSVQMFVPFYTSPFKRGNIRVPPLFPVHQLQFNKNTFTPEIVAQAFKKTVDMFEPDYVIVGDGWGLKPYIASALKKYKVFLRFYAYENLCLMRNGVFLRDGAVCPYNFITHRERCLECINNEMVKRRTRSRLFDEVFISRGLTKEFHELVKRSIKQAHGIIVSNSKTADIVSCLNKNICIVPGGVDTDRFSIHCNNDRKNGRINILMTGRVIDETKGLNILKAACGKLRRKREDFSVTVTGAKKTNDPFIKSSGWLEPIQGSFVTVTGARKTNSSFIKSVGWLQPKQMPRLYKQADICVFPSIWPEPFGLGAVEAMAAGKPVVASNVEGLKQIVIDQETGFLVRPGDADDLAEKIEILLDNPKLRNTMGQAGRKRVEEKYEWNNIFEKYYLPLFTFPRNKKI